MCNYWKTIVELSWFKDLGKIFWLERSWIESHAHYTYSKNPTLTVFIQLNTSYIGKDKV